MADELNSQLIKETELLVEDFKLKLIDILLNERRLKMDSNTIKSLKVISSETAMYVTLSGVDYIYYVIHGRGPGRFPPPDPITGKFKIPFPVAKRIAEKGNRAEFAHVARAFDKAYNEFFEKVKKKSGEISLAYVLRTGTLRSVNI